LGAGRALPDLSLRSASSVAAVAASAHAIDDQAFIDAVSELGEK